MTAVQTRSCRWVVDSGVRVCLCIDGTVKMVLALNPKVVILSTGKCPADSRILRKADTMTSGEALSDKTVGSNVLILGGGAAGMECAEYLA